ncbi:MAG: hypothetical protein QW279_14110, partial [Candidatus Jordarchaeaceae archaeon]
ITIIDMAPERTCGLGGKITDYLESMNNFRYLSPKKVYTPRISGSSAKAVMRFAELNSRSIELLINEYIQNPTEILVINDVTMYFHSGKLEKVIECIKLAKTFLATAYYGKRLNEDLGSGISLREKMLTDRLIVFMDLVIKVDK